MDAGDGLRIVHVVGKKRDVRHCALLIQLKTVSREDTQKIKELSEALEEFQVHYNTYLSASTILSSRLEFGPAALCGLLLYSPYPHSLRTCHCNKCTVACTRLFLLRLIAHFPPPTSPDAENAHVRHEDPG